MTQSFTPSLTKSVGWLVGLSSFPKRSVSLPCSFMPFIPLSLKKMHFICFHPLLKGQATFLKLCLLVVCMALIVPRFILFLFKIRLKIAFHHILYVYKQAGFISKQDFANVVPSNIKGPMAAISLGITLAVSFILK